MSQIDDDTFEWITYADQKPTEAGVYRWRVPSRRVAAEQGVKLMSAVAIQIGNSDDKLTQKQWACFVLETRDCVERTCDHIHFWGSSVNYEPWQNVCCICELPRERVPLLLALIGLISVFFLPWTS